ncbi:MAG: HYR domain-containing protein, partial [Proteobacteria bacterium]|nr:HYR domain-containing protein [Pseudomonadota bacterium]
MNIPSKKSLRAPIGALIWMALLGLSGWTMQVSAETPQAATVPWISIAPSVGHDVISGQATKLKGVEAGQPAPVVPPPPPPPPPTFPFETIDSITVETLSTCGTSPQNFSLNGVALGSMNVNNAHCTCSPPLTRGKTTDPTALAAWDGSDIQGNVGGFSRSDRTTVDLWASMTVTSDGDARKICLFDRSGGGCTTTYLCSGHSSSTVNVSVSNAWNAAAVPADAPDLGSSAVADDRLYFGTKYKWDFGDGDSTGWLNITDPHNLEAAHTYTGAAGSPFTATLTVCDDSDACTSAEYPMVIRAATLDTKINIAIDEGLWALHKGLNRSTGQIVSPGSYGSDTANHAAAMNAFFAHGHAMADEPSLGVVVPRSESNPYVRTMQLAMNYLFTKLAVDSLTVEDGNDPDTNGNGIGLSYTANNHGVYGNGPIIDAIVASGTPSAVAEAGIAEVEGRTYRDIVQDMVDSYAWGQTDTGGGEGGWAYTFQNDTFGDNSSGGWAAIGLIPAERTFGVTIPDFVRTQLDLWMNTSFADLGNSGTYGYTSANCLWGCAGSTAHGMLQLDLYGDVSSAADDANASSRWLHTESWINQNWGAGPSEGNANTVTGYTYALFGATKALRLANPPVETIYAYSDPGNPAAPGPSNGFDWYKDPNKGVARVAVDRQNLNTGHWPSFQGGAGANGLSTSWHVIMLAPALFEAGPRAVAGASPTTVNIGQAVSFDHSESFHLDPSKVITTYEWDFDGDGTFDYSTGDENAVPTFAYSPDVTSLPLTYTAVLRVSDGNLNSTATVDVEVVLGNAPPTAVITPGAITAPQGSVVALSGAASSDPNEGEPLFDSIVEYAWDLDDSNGLTQFVVGTVDASVTFTTPGIHKVGLRVKDSFGLEAVGFATITVPDNQAPVAACQNVTVEAGPGGVADASVDAGSSDADGDDLTITQDPAGPYSLGSTTVTLNVSDGQASDSCSATVTVVDTTDPILVGGADQTLEATSPAGAVATFSVSASDNIDGDLEVTCTPASGSVFPHGETTLVTCTAEDASGNQASTSFSITVEDTTPPDLVIPADQLLEAATAAGTATTFSVTATDIVDTEPTIVCSAASGDTFPIATTTVECTAEDDYDNVSSGSFTITVQDTIAPALVIPADQLLEAASAAGTATTFSVTATDAVDADPTIVCSAASGDTFPIGTTTVDCTAEDDYGNVSSGSFTITVQDTIAPALVIPADQLLEAASA